MAQSSAGSLTFPYTLGRGIPYFEQNSTNGFVDLANANSFNVSIAVEKLEHFSSRAGAKVKDEDIVTQISASGSMVLDIPNSANLRLFSMSSAVTDVSQSSGTGSTQNALNFYWGKWVDFGSVNVTSLVVKDSTDTTTYTLGTDYEVDLAAGLLYLYSSSDGGTIGDGDNLHLTFDEAATTMDKVIAGSSTSIKGNLKFVGNPAKGVIQDFDSNVNLIPEGDLSLVAEEFEQFTLNFECIDQGAGNGLYVLRNRGTI